MLYDLEFETHLNNGTGNACARQSSVTLESIEKSTNSIVLLGTFGEALLIGSRRNIRNINYLNSGTGNACEGHNSVTLAWTYTPNPLTLSIVGNFGGTLPTGSEHKYTPL